MKQLSAFYTPIIAFFESKHKAFPQQKTLYIRAFSSLLTISVNMLYYTQRVGGKVKGSTESKDSTRHYTEHHPSTGKESTMSRNRRVRVRCSRNVKEITRRLVIRYGEPKVLPK